MWQLPWLGGRERMLSPNLTWLINTTLLFYFLKLMYVITQHYTKIASHIFILFNLSQ